jgi:hypothetical protein
MLNRVGNRVWEATPEEIAEMKATNAQAEREYWQKVDYDEAVNAEIRKRYSVSQEFAVLRQKDEKPDEYAAYFAYCEECKAYVKAKKQEVTYDPE